MSSLHVAWKGIAILFLILSQSAAIAQDSTSTVDKVINFPDKLFASLHKKANSIEDNLDKGTDKYLSKLQSQEKRLKRKLLKRDSALAEQVFGDIDAKYNQLRNTTGKVGKYSQVYSGHLDSLSTALNFLKTTSPNLTNHPELQKAFSQYSSLQGRLTATDIIQKQLVERRRMLTQQLERVGMVKELRRYQKQVYYYQAQVREYKQVFEDPTKLEQKLMELALKVPQFKDFFQQNSLLGSLFSLPGSNNSTTNTSLAGLQTRSSVQQLLVSRFGSSQQATQALQQNVQSAQVQLNVLKAKAASYATGSFGNSTGNIDLPKGFSPNEQKTKSFLKRLEVGTNVQSQKARYVFPVTTDLGLSLGYKLSNSGVIGVGASYKLGLGQGWNHFALTHEGVGLRSYIDWKVKGSLYLTGGYEQNYRSAFSTIQQLQQYSSWQTSGLLGLSKRYSVSKKLKAELKLLWDFLSYQQMPHTQAVMIRVGYSWR